MPRAAPRTSSPIPAPVPQGAPADAELARTLGTATRLWKTFCHEGLGLNPAAKMQWRHYQAGWRLILVAKGRNLAYLNPGAGEFTVSFALSDEALDAAESGGAGPRFVASIRESPKLP